MSFASRILAAPVRFYQRRVSPAFAPRCRYAPTCSQYAIEAFGIHGAIKGTLLSVWRILRCNPWSKGGVDRVPPKGEWPKRPLDSDELNALYEHEDAEDHISSGDADEIGKARSHS